MAQIVFMLFEDKQEPEDSEERYKVEVHFTPGAKGREEIIASGESVDSAEITKADISKTLLYTSLKRLVPENKQRRFSNLLPSTLSPTTLHSKTSCAQPPCELDEHVPRRRNKSKSLPSILYVPPLTNHNYDQDSVTHPVDITAQPIPELVPLQLDDSPVNKEPHCKHWVHCFVKLTTHTRMHARTHTFMHVLIGALFCTFTVHGPLISVKPLQRLFTLPLNQLISFLQVTTDNHH